MFLHGCSARGGALSRLGGVDFARQLISEFCGVAVGVELGRYRAVAAIEAVAWEELDDVGEGGVPSMG